MTTLTAQRSTIAPENLDEILSAEKNANDALWGGQGQYETPPNFAIECAKKLPLNAPASVLDPQCASGALFQGIYSYSLKFGIELDNNVQLPGVNLITANCIKAFEAVDDLYPDLRFVVINCNPPFGRKWKRGNGSWIDSTLATWQFATKHGNCGYFIANQKTIEELGLNKHELTYLYETHAANTIWKNMRDTLRIGVVFWKRSDNDRKQWTYTPELIEAWNAVRKIVDEEKNSRPPYNIWLGEDGSLKTYLSVRKQCQIDKLKKLP